MSSRRPPATRRATTSVGSSSSLPRTALRQGKPSPKSPTASASNIPSTSAGCSRSRRGLHRRNTVRGCGVDKLQICILRLLFELKPVITTPLVLLELCLWPLYFMPLQLSYFEQQISQFLAFTPMPRIASLSLWR